jgi:hypothetical protein
MEPSLLNRFPKSSKAALNLARAALLLYCLWGGAVCMIYGMQTGTIAPIEIATIGGDEVAYSLSSHPSSDLIEKHIQHVKDFSSSQLYLITSAYYGMFVCVVVVMGASFWAAYLRQKEKAERNNRS